MRRYVLGVTAITLLMLGAVALFNRLIDPFDLYGDVSIRGLNRVKTEIATFERHVQPQVIRRRQPNALVLGSSVEKIGLDPTHPAFSDGGQRSVYNFAMYGGGWSRTLCYFEYAVDAAPLQRAVIGILPEALPPVDCANEVPEIAGFSAARLLLSKATLAASYYTIRRQHAGRSLRTQDGRALLAVGDANRAEAFPRVLARMAETRYPGTHCQYGRQLPGSLPAPDRELELGGLKKMLELAQQRNIELKLFIRPSPAQVLEIDLACDRIAQRWASIGAIADLVARYPNSQLWGFDIYNTFTVERVSGGEQKYWPDALHFYPSYGDSMLDLMFGSVEPATSTVGTRLTPATMAPAYRAYVESRTASLERDPWLSDEVRALAHRIKLPIE